MFYNFNKPCVHEEKIKRINEINEELKLLTKMKLPTLPMFLSETFGTYLQDLFRGIISSEDFIKLTGVTLRELKYLQDFFISLYNTQKDNKESRERELNLKNERTRLYKELGLKE